MPGIFMSKREEGFIESRDLEITIPEESQNSLGLVTRRIKLQLMGFVSVRKGF